MAELKNVKRYFETIGLKEQYVLLTKQTIEQHISQISKIVDLDEEDRGEMLAETDELIEKVSPKIIEEAEKIYTELFSDEEISELIAISLSPIAIRSRELQPEIFKRIVSISDSTIREELKEHFDD